VGGLTYKDTEYDPKFGGGVMKDLGSILQTQAGRELIHELHGGDKQHHTTIMWNGKPHDPVTNAQINPGGKKDDRFDHGPGEGSNVLYRPGEVQHAELGMKDDQKEPWFPQRSDVALFHELTHAMHNEDGTATKGDAEEVETVGVKGWKRHGAKGVNMHEGVTENAYRAERVTIGQGTVGVRNDKVDPSKEGVDSLDDATMKPRDWYFTDKDPR
jgi:hypothetical protein